MQGGGEMNCRPSRGPGTKRPGPLAGDDVRNSWGPSWGLGRVLASSLLTSPTPRAGPCSPRAPAWNPGLAAASAPTVGSAQLSSAQLGSARLSWPQQRRPRVCCQRLLRRHLRGSLVYLCALPSSSVSCIHPCREDPAPLSLSPSQHE